MSLLPSLKLDDIPVDKARPLSGSAIMGQVQLKDIAGGYVQITAPLFYFSSEDPQNGVMVVDRSMLEALTETVSDFDSAKAAGMRTWTARWNVKPEWFEHEFLYALRHDQVPENVKTQFNMNMAIAKGLYKNCLGMEKIDFETPTAGKIVGFRAAGNKKEPDKLQIKLFFAAKKAA